MRDKGSGMDDLQDQDINLTRVTTYRPTVTLSVAGGERERGAAAKELGS